MAPCRRIRAAPGLGGPPHAVVLATAPGANPLWRLLLRPSTVPAVPPWLPACWSHPLNSAPWRDVDPPRSQAVQKHTTAAVLRASPPHPATPRPTPPRPSIYPTYLCRQGHGAQPVGPAMRYLCSAFVPCPCPCPWCPRPAVPTYSTRDPRSIRLHRRRGMPRLPHLPTGLSPASSGCRPVWATTPAAPAHTGAATVLNRPPRGGARGPTAWDRAPATPPLQATAGLTPAAVTHRYGPALCRRAHTMPLCAWPSVCSVPAMAFPQTSD
eukprot:gene3950-4313_t